MPTKAETIADERIRIQKILQSPEGLAHPKSAIHFALNSDVTADLANTLMADLPKESAFLDAMDQQGAIGIKPGGSAGLLSGDAKTARMEEIKAGSKAYNAARGYGSRAS